MKNARQCYLETFLARCQRRQDKVTRIGDKRDVFQLDDHQRAAMSAVMRALENNHEHFSIVHSCGSGKTVLEANLLAASQEAKQEIGEEDLQDIILTTERALIQGIHGKLQAIGLDVGIWGDHKKVLDRPILLATVQALQMNFGHLAKQIALDRVGMIVGDEADNYLTPLRRQIIARFSNALRIGFTATPSWPDGRDISEIWGPKIHNLSLRDGILKGINVSPLFYLFNVTIDADNLTVHHGEYERKTLEAAFRTVEIEKAVPEVYRTLIPEGEHKKFPTLVYVPSINLVRSVTETLRQQFSREGIKVKGWVAEDLSVDEVSKDLELFEDGELDILVLCEMGGRGVDLVRARCLIDAYPTISTTKLEQRHGRVMRRLRPDSKFAQEFEKPFVIIAQITPRSGMKRRPCYLPDLLDCWDEIKSNYQGGTLLFGEKLGSKNAGAPIQDEIAKLSQRIMGEGPEHYVELVRQFDMYESLQAIKMDLPRADENGFFLEELEENFVRFGTMYAWERELGIGRHVIKRRLGDYEGQSGYALSGQFLEKAFFPEPLVRRVCADFIKDVPEADAKGFFMDKKSGEKIGNIGAWADLFGVDRATIRSRLEGRTGTAGKLVNGNILPDGFYPETLIRKLCGDIIQKVSKADDEGFIYSGGERSTVRYATRKRWAAVLGLNQKTVERRLRGYQGITGKTSIGHLSVEGFFLESLVRERCADLLR